ncbi:TRI7 protein [Blastomyces dermatitidis ER-3]|uniref:TRI7 protein n=1 Tax=Ajellomyces dermatitidis (strain ER-3 / ATCC MYA-2586) TaxID=559297 RepID=A0ABP2EUQ6_AJEDR|nr:TRI7 protein [Blastomyces dermatitidis ER-3]EEQ87592.1 TRI7 protein [Blastomyces dermatitidis ER-3]
MWNYPRAALLAFWYLAQGLGMAFLVKYSRKGSLLRIVGFTCVAAVQYFFYTSSFTLGNNILYSASLASMSPALFAHCINILFINPIDAQHGLGISIGLNLRGIGTPWLAKNTPEFPSYYGGRRPGRFIFLLRQSAIVIWQYLMIDLLEAAGSAQSPEEIQMVQGLGSEFMYLSATKEQLIARIATSLVSNFVMSRMMVDGVARLLSIISVGLRISNPSDWPPLFNSMWDAYTLRNYWGKFWHQMLRWPFTSISNYLTRRVLRLPRPSFLERYLNILFVFSLSGILHVPFLAATSISILDSWRGSMLYFTSFTLGFMIEDTAQALWRRLGVEKLGSQPASAGVTVFKRVVGMLWVISFMCMTVPFFGYPVSRVPAERRELIPSGFSIVRVVGPEPVLGAVGVGALFLKFGFGAGL